MNNKQEQQFYANNAVKSFPYTEQGGDSLWWTPQAKGPGDFHHINDGSKIKIAAINPSNDTIQFEL